MSGLPCSGKSSLAREIARRHGMFLVELDHLEGPLLQVVDGDTLGWVGYDMITALARDNLSLGHSVVLDSVAWTTAIRDRWAEMARDCDALWRPIEVVCSDKSAHRSRVDGRRRGIPGVPEVTWGRVVRAEQMFEPWTGSRLVLDSVKPLDGLINEACEYVTTTQLIAQDRRQMT